MHDKMAGLEKRDLQKVVLGVALFVFAISLLFRFFSEGFFPAGASSYHDLEIARSFTSFWYQDMSVAGTRMILVTPYHLLLFLVVGVFGMKISLFFLPLLLLGGFLFTMIEVSFSLHIRPRALVLALLGFIISPAMVHLSTRFTQELFVLFLISISIYLALSQNPFHRMLSYPVMLLVAWSGLVPTLLLIVGLRYVIKVAGHTRKRLVMFSTLLFLVSLFLAAYTSQYLDIVSVVPTWQMFLSKTVTILGGSPGISGFLIVLSVVGFFETLRLKKRYYLLYGLILLLFVSTALSALDPSVYLTLLLLPFALAGYERFLERRWQLDLVRRLTLMIIFYGLLFSVVAYARVSADAAPSEELITTLHWMKENIDPGRTVLTSRANGFYVSSIAGHPVLSDDAFYRIEGSSDIERDIERIFSSRNLAQTADLFKEYQIGYILITPEMLEGSPFSQPDEGLLFLLSNEEFFERSFGFKGHEIWAYQGPLEYPSE